MSLIIILIAGLQTGCGIGQELSKACVPGDLQHVCNAFIGYPDDDSELEDRIEVVEGRIDQLERQTAALETSISNLINYVELVIADNENDVANVQDQIDLLTIQLAALQTNLSVVGLVDPCGDGPGYDEVLLKMSDNSYVAYFQTGNGNNQKRFLSVLNEGVNYQTTDQQACLFKILNGEIVEL
jgi:uncharacterized coiled-coil protein SlyX